MYVQEIKTIQMVDVKELTPHPSNPRHGNLEKITESIKANGFYGTLVVQKSTGFIIAGNHRYKAAVELGITHLPASFLDVDDSTALRILIADNRTSDVATNDEEQIAAILSQLGVEEMLEGSGFSEEELNDLLKSLGQLANEKDPDIVPEPDKTTTIKFGDLFQLGEHRVLCGDSTKAEDVERLMGGGKADMVFTDPPYGVDYDGGGTFASDGKTWIPSNHPKLEGDGNTDLYGPCCEMAFKSSVDNAPMYLWHAGVKGISAAAAAAAAGYEIRAEIIWNKQQAQFGAISAHYKQKHEPAFYCFKRGRSDRWNGPTNEVTVWDIDRASKNEFHPTQKPVALAERAIGNHDVLSVLDLFLGSGSTLIACEQLDRKCYGMEIEPLYVDVVIKRWENYTGGKAVQIG